MHTNEMNVQNITLLAIESSCDDTAASVIKDGKILSNMIAGQDLHKNFGGVVPELASRAHQQNILPIVDLALTTAGFTIQQMDAIAFTQGPGLMGALLVGHNFAKGLALALNKPLIAVNHLEAHVMAHLIENPNMAFPFLCLLVSGGHTQIVKVNSATDIEILGKTMDDAAGEAFDKAAKILGISYPGGPLIDKYSVGGNPKAYKFSTGKVSDLDFSFSGFKTNLLYFIRDEIKKDAAFIEKNRSDLCASIQFTIVDYLLLKLKNAAIQTKIKIIAIAGGVAANSELRAKFLTMAKENSWEASIPAKEYCTDNAAMIAMAAVYKFKANQFSDLDENVFASSKNKLGK